MKAASYILLGALASPALADDSTTFTLYRGDEGSNAKVHVATFDSNGGARYNHESCQLAADLFQLQPGVKSIFWCERGRYRA